MTQPEPRPAVRMTAPDAKRAKALAPSSAWSPFVRDVPTRASRPVSAIDFVRVLHTMAPQHTTKQQILGAFRYLQMNQPHINMTRPVLSMYMTRVCGSAALVEAAWSLAGARHTSVRADAWSEEPTECVAEGKVAPPPAPLAVKHAAHVRTPARPPTPTPTAAATATPPTCHEELGAAAPSSGAHPCDDMGMVDCFSQTTPPAPVPTLPKPVARRALRPPSLAMQRRDWRARLARSNGTTLYEPSLRVMLLKRRARIDARGRQRQAHVMAVKARLAAQLAAPKPPRQPVVVPPLAAPTGAAAAPDDVRMEPSRKRRRTPASAAGACACGGGKRCKRCRDAERRRHDMERRDLRCVTCGTNASTGYWRGASTPTPTCASCVRRESRARVRAAKRMRAEAAAKASA